jgi:hypothetical protein
MVELQIVILAVAGSSPVGHPARGCAAGNPKLQIPSSKQLTIRRRDHEFTEFLDIGIWVLEFPPKAVACALLKAVS